MDRELKKFVRIFAALAALLILATLGIIIIQNFFTMDMYRGILNFLIICALILLLFLLISAVSTIHVYKSKRVKPIYVIPVKFGLKVLIPLVIFFTGLIDSGKDEIRRFYIEVNNVLVKSKLKKYGAKDLLILLPHCLQYSECEVKITKGIEKCKRCGKCDLDDISRLCEKYGVNAFVVTGGTAARKIVKEKRPKLVLSVACERDLVSGISDVKRIPVFGVLNTRPNGPCFNTKVKVGEIEKHLLLCGVKKIDE